MEKKIQFKPSVYWLIHPAALALYVFIVLLYFIPNYFQKYPAKITNFENRQYDYYEDLNGDSISEKINLHDNDAEYSTGVSFYFQNKIAIDQWNLKGKRLLKPQLNFGDFDHDTYKETYLITIYEDSLYLNIFEPLDDYGIRLESRFLCKTNFYKGRNTDVVLVGNTFMDVNKDGFDEYVFTLHSGFSIYPRNTFIYDLKNDSLLISPLNGSGFRSALNYLDINNDGVPEITGAVYASDNIHDSTPYSDQDTYLYVLDPSKQLHFLFEPIKVSHGISSSISSKLFMINGNAFIAATFYDKNEKKTNNRFFIAVYDIEGNKKYEHPISYEENSFMYFLPQFDTTATALYLYDKDGIIYKTDTSVSWPFEILIENNFNDSFIYERTMDIDKDGKNEHIFYTQHPLHDQLIISRSDFSDFTVISLPYNRMALERHYSVLSPKDKNNIQLVAQIEDNLYYFDYHKSDYFWLKYPFYFLLYLLIFLGFYLLQKTQKSVVAKRYETEKQLIQQQMALSKKQVEPHFILNMINNIGYMFSKDDKKSAMYYLGKFGNIMRRGLLNAQASQITLEEELEFVEDYLILQKKLMDDELEYSLKVDEQIETELIKIPHSIIYTFVENAIKHGLKPKENDRNLSIIVEAIEGKTKITIQDNGIGRSKSKTLGTSDTGKGMEIVKTIIKGYNQLHGGKINYTVEDINDENKLITGTLVCLYF